MRRVVLSLLVLWVVGVAAAQPGATAVRSAARTWTEEQILTNVTGNRVSKGIQWGRVVRYGGNIIMAGTLVYTALEWFYDQAQRSTGTALDAWWDEEPGFTGAAMVTVEATGASYTQCAGPNTSTVTVNYRSRMGPESGTWDYLRTAGGDPWPIHTACVTGRPGTGGVPIDYEAAFASAPPPSALVDGKPTIWHNIEQFRGRVGGWEPTLLNLGGGALVRPAARLVVEDTRDPLYDFLVANPGASNAVRTQVLPGYVDNETAGAGFPNTYAQPFPGIELEDTPNINQWYDNPWANPELDTDGDGWPDWKEVVAGTDPNDPNSQPTVDPAPEPEPGEEPMPDADGDGIPDIYDPCPFDALNRCADAVPEPIEIPDDYAREVTLQGVATDTAGVRTATERTADATEQIRDLLEGQGELVGESVMPELEGAWSSVGARLQGSLEAIRVAASGKVGFNAGGLIPQLTASGGGSCEEITITLLGITRPLGWCGSTFYNLVTTWGRNGIALLMLIGFAFASARTVGAL